MQFTQNKANSIILDAAISYINAGLRVVPCENKYPVKKLKKLVSKIKYQKALHLGNYEYYFSDAPQIGLFVVDGFEVIDVDCKYDLTGKIRHQFLISLKYSLGEDVFQKLVIENTPTGGLHIYYKSKLTSANKKLAQRPAISTEREKGERVKVLIERIGQGGQIICSPSPGYNLTQGEIEDIQEISIDERTIITNICLSFDKMPPAPIVGVTKYQNSLQDAPWKVFNKENKWEWMVEKLKELQWEVSEETDEIVSVKRPGTDAKRSGSIFKETNCLYLFSTSTEFEAGVPISAFGMHCTLAYEGDVKACAKGLAEQGIGTWNADQSEFYTITDNKKIEKNYAGILLWLEDAGYCKISCSKTDFDIGQKIGGIIKISSLDKIKKTFGEYIKENTPDRIYNEFLSSLKTIFTKEGIISQLNDLDDRNFIKSTADAGWMFFRNTALKITANHIEHIPYEVLESYGHVWEKNIIQRDYTPGDFEGDMSKFIELISGARTETIEMFMAAFGYLIHDYKDPANPRAIVFNDEFYDENGTEPQGGSGKGLLIKALSHCKPITTVDGKRFDPTSQFAYQAVNLDTKIFAIEDAKQGLNFEIFFSAITEGLLVEQKGKTPFLIPYDRSPKVLITSNYAIKGSSSSHLRRRYELEVAPFFSSRNRPLDYFGRRLFDDWDIDEWAKFDNYVILCLQSFLKTGLPKEVTVNLMRKKMIQETNADFVRWMDQLLKNEGLPEPRIRKDDLKAKFTVLYPDYLVKLTMSKFTKWLVRYCSEYNIEVDARNIHEGHMVYAFRKLPVTVAESVSTYEKTTTQKVLIETETAFEEPVLRRERYEPIELGEGF